jgi:hypothetical protein
LVCTRVGRENASAEYPAVNPDAPDSAMAIMKQTLTTLLHEHSRSQTDALKLQQERQERFEKEVRDALVRLESKRTYDQKTPRSGSTSKTRRPSSSPARFVMRPAWSKSQARLPVSAPVARRAISSFASRRRASLKVPAWCSRQNGTLRIRRRKHSRSSIGLARTAMLGRAYS